jgi:uncharacterized membrane protein YoaK (UPF0700 family)
MEKGKSNAAFKVAFLTGATIFIMGYVNAMALHTEHLLKMVTPQTGNIVWLGVYPVSGDWSAWGAALLLFAGFVFGCGFAVVTNKSFKTKKAQFYFNWTLFALPVAVYPFVMDIVGTHVGFLMMGLSAGFGVGFFRVMYHLDQINNAMATGSVRFIGVYLAEVFVKKNAKEKFTLVLFIICVALFALGGTAFAIMHGVIDGGTAGAVRTYVSQGFSAVSIALLVFCIVPCLFAAPKNTE